MSANRVYIANLDFTTTEDELLEHFKPYQVVSVLIPSQTVRFFRNNQVRPLGIAYAEFPSLENALQAIDSLNGKTLKGRELRLKPYVPYCPVKVTQKMSKSKAFYKLRKNRRGTGDVLVSTSGALEEDAAEHGDAIPPQASNESLPHEDQAVISRDDGEATEAVASAASPAEAAEVTETAEAARAPKMTGQVVATEQFGGEPAYSNDTLYLGYLPKEVDDIEIRNYLKGYHPNEIWIFRTRPKGKHLQLHRHFMAALVTVKTKEKLDDVLEALSKKKFNGKRITVRRARLNKLKEVQSMADAPPSEELDVDILPQAEIEAQTQEAGASHATAAGSAGSEIQEHEQVEQRAVAA